MFSSTEELRPALTTSSNGEHLVCDACQGGARIVEIGEHRRPADQGRVAGNSCEADVEPVMVEPVRRHLLTIRPAGTVEGRSNRHA